MIPHGTRSFMFLYASSKISACLTYLAHLAA